MKNNYTLNKLLKSIVNVLSKRILFLIAILVILIALIRIFVKDAYFVEKIDERTLLYLGIAAALILVKDLKSFAFGDYKVEFQAKLEAIEIATKDTQAIAISGGSGGMTYGKEIQPGKFNNDPWKGVFGGKSKSNFRQLSAKITTIEKDWFGISLFVVSTSNSYPLKGSVQFFLHDTFAKDRPRVTVQRGEAKLYIEAYGAFTVGVITDNGDTQLELDLAQIKGAPKYFREN